MSQNLYLLIKFVSNFFKKKLIKLQILILINSILQIISIFSFAPLILFLTNPSEINSYNIKFLNHLDNESLLIYLVLSVILIFVLSNISNIIVSKVSLTLGQKIGIDLNYKIFSYIINKNYSYHSETNSAEIISKITLESARVINSILIPILLINARFFMAFVILVGIIILNFQVSIVVFFFIVIAYYLIFFIQKKKLLTNSQLISKNNRVRQQTISESLGNMRETILFKSQNLFLKLFNESNEKIGLSIASNQFLSTIPRHLIEIFAFILLMIFIFFLQSSNLLIEYLPLLGIYIVAAYKLLPSIQNIATSYASIKGNFTALENISSEIEYINNNVAKFQEINNIKNEIKTKNLSFLKLEMKNFNFSYKDKNIFYKADLDINSGEIVGITGETGIGKSSLIDLICGLRNPSDGILKINDKDLDEKKKLELINIISLVPQKINLIDDTIRNNIIFPDINSENDKIMHNLEYLKKICILDYIDNISLSWDSFVGENGSKLSGGQIQRLGLARALYKTPQILILDEATAALDSSTQTKILKNLKDIRPHLTIIIISHSNEVLNICDRVFEIKNYKIVQK